MHPRNIYNTLPNFKELAITYPEFRQHIKIDLAGKAHLDFQNPQALAALTKTLLLKDFSLDVEIPCDKLIPTLPLRLNYILWIEDLVKAARLNPPIEGIDIGTGACCIYPLLAAKKGWRMLATDISTESIEAAASNIERNSLSDLITLQQVLDRKLVLQGVLPEGKNYSFCMCNPPFFAPKEKPQNRSKTRQPPKRVFSGVSEEVETEGGEIAFIRKIINDSLELRDRIAIYTTLVGKLCNLKLLKKELLNNGFKNVVTTVFEQGKTTRWGLAWSFTAAFPMAAVKKKKTKLKPPVSYTLPEGTVFEDAVRKIKDLMTTLKVTFEVEKPDPFVCNVTAFENSWSNQRRKRRAELQPTPEKKRKTEDSSESPKKEEELKKAGTEVTGEECMEGEKREIVSGERSREFSAESSGKAIAENGETCSSKREPVLEFNLKVLRAEDAVCIEALWLAGSSGKEGMHQVLQYFKNNWDSTSTNC